MEERGDRWGIERMCESIRFDPPTERVKLSVLIALESLCSFENCDPEGIDGCVVVLGLSSLQVQPNLVSAHAGQRWLMYWMASRVLRRRVELLRRT